MDNPTVVELNHTWGYPNSTINSESVKGTQFELAEDEKETFTQKWRTDVERSVAMGGLVPTEVIKLFKGEDWADEELALREAVMRDPEIWHMAEDSDNPEELREKLKYALVDDQELADNPLYDPEEVQEHKQQRELLEQALASLNPSGKGATGDWVERLSSYAHDLTQDEQGQRFIREYASGKEGVLKLKAAIGKGHQTPVLSKRVRPDQAVAFLHHQRTVCPESQRGDGKGVRQTMDRAGRPDPVREGRIRPGIRSDGDVFGEAGAHPAAVRQVALSAGSRGETSLHPSGTDRAGKEKQARASRACQRSRHGQTLGKPLWSGCLPSFSKRLRGEYAGSWREESGRNREWGFL